MLLKKFIQWVIVISICSGLALAQTPTSGLVVLQNSGRQPVSGVQVEDAFGDAAPKVSDSEGKFTLTFQNSAYGELTTLYVKKSGLEVVNQEEIKDFRITRAPFKIVVCPEGQLNDNRLRYYKISTAQIEQEYQVQLATLKKKLADNEAALRAQVETLEEQREIAQKQARELARRFALVNLDDVSQLYRDAFDLFQQGKIEEAIQLIQEADLQAQIQQAKTKKKLGDALSENARAALEQHAQTVTLEARLHVSRLEFEEARQAYALALSAVDSNDVQMNLEYGLFLYGQFRFEDAIQIYQKTLALVPENKAYQAYLHYLLGATHQGNLEQDLAEKLVSKSIELYRELAARNPARYRQALGAVLFQQISLLSDQFDDKSDVLIQSKAEAESIFKDLVAKDSTHYLGYYALTQFLEFIDAVKYAEKDEDKSLRIMLEKLAKGSQLYAHLSEQNPEIYEPFLGLSLVLQGGLGEAFIAYKKHNGEVYNHERLVAPSDSLFDQGVELLSKCIERVEKSHPNISINLIKPDSLMRLEDYYHESDGQVFSLFGHTFSIINMLYKYQGLFGMEVIDFQRIDQLLKVATEKANLLAEQNPERYALFQTSFGLLLGLRHFQNGEYPLVIQNLERHLPKFEELYQENANTYRQTLGTCLRLIFASQSLYYLANKTFYQDDSLGVLTKGQRALSLLEADSVSKEFEMGIQDTKYWLQCYKRGNYEDFYNLCIFLEYKAAADQATTLETYASNYTEAIYYFEQIAERTLSREDAQQLIQLYQDYHDLEVFRDRIYEVNAEELGYVKANQFVETMEIYEDREELFPRDTTAKYLWKEAVFQSQLLKAYPDSTELKQSFVFNLGNVAFYALFQKNYERSLIAAERALSEDSTQHWIYTNLALAYLFNDRYPEALRVYYEWMNRPYQYDSTQLYQETFLQDIKDLEKEGITHPRFKEIEKMLKKPENFPEELRKGFDYLQKARQAYLNAQETTNISAKEENLNLSRTQYEAFIKLNTDSNSYFQSDLSEAFYRMGRIYYDLDLPLHLDTLSLNLTTKKANRISNEIFRYFLQSEKDSSFLSLKELYRRELYPLRIIAQWTEQIYQKAPEDTVTFNNLQFIRRHIANYALFAEQFKLSLKYAKTGVNANPKDATLLSRLALAYLFNDEYEEATKICQTWKGRPYPDDNFDSWGIRTLALLEGLQKEGITHPEAEKLKKLLKE